MRFQSIFKTVCFPFRLRVVALRVASICLACTKGKGGWKSEVDFAMYTLKTNYKNKFCDDFVAK
jgi:hypothetical protein